MEIIRKYYKSDFSITSKPGIWRIYEHMRWDVYTRTLGYVLPDKNLLKKEETEDAEFRKRAKAHNDLVPFEELSKEDQGKDSLELTDEVVKILESC